MSTRRSKHPRFDSPIMRDLNGVTYRPVFIVGLHRSGTTFLYQMLSGSFPVASLTVYHVLFYDSILTQYSEGSAVAAQQNLDRTFQSWGMATRSIDDVSLSHAMPEEYGWLLRSRTGSFRTRAKSARLLDEVCRKLQYTSPDARAVLLKNPWDTGHVPEIMANFPDSRFLFLQRDPLAIVNSQFRVVKYLGEHKDPFIELLFSLIPLGRTWTWAQRTMRNAAGESRYGRLALGVILRRVTRELDKLEVSWRASPPELRMALQYRELIGDQNGTLSRVESFLGLSPRRHSVCERANPRCPALLPEVAAVEADFRRILRERGIAQNPLDRLPQT